MFKKFLLLGHMFIFCLPSALSAPVNNLHDVRWPVDEQGESTRNQSFVDAFVEVLIRVTGNSDVMTDYPLDLDAKKVRRYVQSYHYERNNDRNQTNRYWLNIKFDGEQTERFLTAKNAPVWSNNRPLILGWLAIEDERGKRLVNSEQMPEIGAQWQFHSQRRGLPTLLPSLDLQDADAIQPSDIRGQFENTLIAASDRYGVNTIMGAYFQKLGDYWLTRWLVIDSCANQRWRFESHASVAEALGEGIDRLANFLGECYSISGSNQQGNKVQLVIENIRSTVDYGKSLAAIEKLAGVKRVALNSIAGGRLTLDLWLTVDTNNLKQAIRLVRQLQPLASPMSDPALTNQLVYEWLP